MKTLAKARKMAAPPSSQCKEFQVYLRIIFFHNGMPTLLPEHVGVQQQACFVGFRKWIADNGRTEGSE